MKWKRIKGFPNYRISSNGDVYSLKTDRMLKPYDLNNNGVLYVTLHNRGDSKTFQLAKLVIDVFQPSQTTINTFAIHKDLELENCSNPNLERGTRADRKRMFNEIRGKKRGVYPWKIGKNKFRVAFKNRAGKYVTVGYYKTQLFAEFRYIQAYKKEFGRLPY